MMIHYNKPLSYSTLKWSQRWDSNPQRILLHTRLQIGAVINSGHVGIKLADKVGFEPTTKKLTVSRSTSELLVNIKWWAVLDSNQRTPKGGNLQSPAIAAMRTTHLVQNERIELSTKVWKTPVLPLN